MHALPSIQDRPAGGNELETLVLSDRHLDYLGQLAREMNPDMPESFGLPHLIRRLIDRIEESGIDLTDASSEEEIARLAAGRLGGDNPRRPVRPSERFFASTATPSGARRSHRSSLPARGRFRSGTTPRSTRG
jgi:hypothetical protein